MPKSVSARSFTQADLTRAIKAICKAGQAIIRTEIDRDGTIRIIHAQNDVDPATPPFDTWKARRDARQA